jgi:3-hydroxyacyl-CoA dehydrogenase
MRKIVDLETTGGIAVLTISNPPVNALSVAVRVGLVEAIKAASSDSEVHAIIIACTGRTFIGGADIREFGRPLEPPGLDEINALLEDCPKPVVAAIHGVAFGGGLELAMACHFRIARSEAKLGQPEVKLGLIPGGGGTQRLPRAIGPERAVQMIVSGEPMDAGEALAFGLVDAVFEGDSVAAALAFARKLLVEERPLRRLRDDDSKLSAARSDRSKFTAAAAAVNKRTRGLEAPLACAEAVGWSIDLPFKEGLKKERETFVRLLHGDQSRAQRHVFFAEREAAKISGVPAQTQPREVNRVAIVGAGTMGSGIAMAFANAGIPVKLVEVSGEALARGLATIRKNYEATAARAGVSAEETARRIAIITGVVGLEQVGDADLIIEAVFETMEIKKGVFSSLDKLAKPDAILATNTSYLDIDAIAAVTSRPQDVVGMHFFSPANVMKLCEVVRGKNTVPEVLVTATRIARRIGKVPVVVGVCHGFVGNRMLEVRFKQADKLLYAGALPQQVDAVLTKFGMPMGIFAMADLAGLDIGWRSRQDRGEKSEIADALCESGRMGQKSGKGYYKYEDGSRAPLPDPDVEALIEETCRRLDIRRRPVSDDEIFERMTYPMINEGARILHEGIATRPGDIDIIWLYGYGWPAYRGGPMYYGEQVGLPRVAERLAYYATIDHDETLRPAPLLEKLAFSGDTFTSVASNGSGT